MAIAGLLRKWSV